MQEITDGSGPSVLFFRKLPLAAASEDSAVGFGVMGKFDFWRSVTGPS